MWCFFLVLPWYLASQIFRVSSSQPLKDNQSLITFSESHPSLRWSWSNQPLYHLFSATKLSVLTNYWQFNSFHNISGVRNHIAKTTNPCDMPLTPEVSCVDCVKVLLRRPLWAVGQVCSQTHGAPMVHQRSCTQTQSFCLHGRGEGPDARPQTPDRKSVV